MTHELYRIGDDTLVIKAIALYIATVLSIMLLILAYIADKLTRKK